jgi:hypothetical protein
VRSALGEARGLLQAFRDDRARLAQVEDSVARLREDMEYRYMDPAEHRLLDRGEQELERAERERETALVQVLALLQRVGGSAGAARRPLPREAAGGRGGAQPAPGGLLP